MRKRHLLTFALAVAVVIAGCTPGVATVVPGESPTPSSVAASSPSANVQPTPTDRPTPTPTETPSPTTAAAPAPVPAGASPPQASDLDVAWCQGPCWPLSGRPLDGNANLRPMAVRLDNAIPSQPQAGLNSADVVIDSIIEGCVNRLLAVFHSRGSPSLGAIRSARRYDLQLLPMLRGVLAHVGASDEVNQWIRDAAARGEFVDIDEYQFLPRIYPDYHQYYWRINWKPAPHNMYSSSVSLRAAANSAPGGSASVTVPSLGFLPGVTHEPTAGGFARSVPATTVTFPSAGGQACPQGNNILGYRDDYVPNYTYDAASRGYRRYASDRTTSDEYAKAPVLARNVVVMWIRLDVTNVIASQGSWGVAYQVQPYTTGGGRLAVYRDGLRADGTWSRATSFDAFDLRNGEGEKILLSPGQTWIHFVPTYWNVR